MCLSGKAFGLLALPVIGVSEPSCKRAYYLPPDSCVPVYFTICPLTWQTLQACREVIQKSKSLDITLLCKMADEQIVPPPQPSPCEVLSVAKEPAPKKTYTDATKIKIREETRLSYTVNNKKVATTRSAALELDMRHLVYLYEKKNALHLVFKGAAAESLRRSKTFENRLHVDKRFGEKAIRLVLEGFNLASFRKAASVVTAENRSILLDCSPPQKPEPDERIPPLLSLKALD